MNMVDAYLLIKKHLTWCVSLDVTLDHLTHKVSKGGIGRAGVIICLTVTATETNKI